MFEIEGMPTLRPVSVKLDRRNVFTIVWHWLSFFRRWEIAEDWYFELDGKRYMLPKDFNFNGASIPRTYWWILSPVGVLFTPAMIHDWMYNKGTLMLDDGTEVVIDRKYADTIFKRISNDINGLTPINWVVYWCLRAYGWIPWSRHKRNREKLTSQ